MNKLLSRGSVLNGLRSWVAPVVRASSVAESLGPYLCASGAPKLEPSISAIAGKVHVRFMHDRLTKGEEELANFLREEIETEIKSRRGTDLPTKLDDFEIKTKQADVTLTKKRGDETITISLSINHSVDAEVPSEDMKNEPKEGIEMKSKPNFDIEIVKGVQTVCFSCSFMRDDGQQDPQEEYDSFIIDEICTYTNEYVDETYTVAGDILDGYLYDLFMNYLEERGITNDFADKLSDFCTDYEHRQYVDMLGSLQKFLTM